MRRLSQIVNYDVERNTFYKINKQTGEQSTTLKNGDPLKKFRPDVTGHHYLIRKHIDQDLTHSHPRQSSIESEHSHLDPLHRTHLDPLQRTHLDPLQRTHRSIRKETKHTETSVFNTTALPRHSSFGHHEQNSPSLKIQLENDRLSPEKSEEQLKNNILNQTLTSYSKLLKQQISRNNSPKKDTIPANQPLKDPLATLCTTISHFNIKQPSWQPEIARKQQQIKNRRQLAPEYSPKAKLAHEKAIFLQFHPELQAKINPKAMEVQVQRKRNLRILQELFIRQNNKTTRKVYQSIS